VNVIWASTALADREMIYDYIDAENPRAAAALDVAFVRAAERLGVHPEAGRKGQIVGTREWVVHPHYVLVYESGADVVLILAVVHTARQWPADRDGC